VGRHHDDALEAILERGRQTRKPVPRALWIAAALVAVICAIGVVAIGLGLGDAAPARTAVERPPSSGAGFGSGLAIGAAAGLAIGFALARTGQRRDHSSRNRP
jgi:hypothetical protein